MEQPLSTNLTLAYAGLAVRVKAIITDTVVLIIMMLLTTAVFSMFQTVPDQARVIAMVFIFLLYDPLFTSSFGGTIGHQLWGLRVKRAMEPTKNINFFLALMRFLVKAALGWFSLLTVQGNEKRRAMHDYLAGSVVVYAPSRQ